MKQQNWTKTEKVVKKIVGDKKIAKMDIIEIGYYGNYVTDLATKNPQISCIF
jgi:hypothetical protein